MLLAGEEEEDKARDQNPGEPPRRHQYHISAGSGEGPGVTHPSAHL